MLLKELTLLTEGFAHSRLEKAAKSPFVIVNLSIASQGRGNGPSSLRGSIKTFSSLNAMAKFLKSSECDDDYEVRLHMSLSPKDIKKLGLEKYDYKKDEDGKLYLESIKNISPEEYMSLDAARKVYLSGDVDPDNYDWLIVVRNGKKEKWFDDVADELNDAVID